MFERRNGLKKTPFGGLGPFSQKISEAPLGANDPVISPLPPSTFNPSVTISLLLNSQSPLLSACWPVLCSSCSRCVVFFARCTRVRPA